MRVQTRIQETAILQEPALAPDFVVLVGTDGSILSNSVIKRMLIPPLDTSYSIQVTGAAFSVGIC